MKAADLRASGVVVTSATRTTKREISSDWHHTRRRKRDHLIRARSYSANLTNLLRLKLTRLVLRQFRGRDLPGPLGVQFWILRLTASLLRERERVRVRVRESKCAINRTGPATKRLHQRDHRPTEEHFASCAVLVAPDLQLGPMCQRAQVRLVRNKVRCYFGLFQVEFDLGC